MKYLAVAFLALTAQFGFSQTCTRTGSFQETDVSIVGTAQLVQNGNVLTIEIGSDFQSDSGPDLDVYLSNESNPTASGMRLEALLSLSGAQSYVVPNGINISDYNYIVIHCTQYSHLYGYALLGTATGDCSIALGEEEYALEEVKLKVRNNEIQISGLEEVEDYQIRIVNIEGKLIANDTATIYSNLKQGIYLVNITAGKSKLEQKVVIR